MAYFRSSQVTGVCLNTNKFIEIPLSFLRKTCNLHRSSVSLEVETAD